MQSVVDFSRGIIENVINQAAQYCNGDIITNVSIDTLFKKEL